MTLVVLNDLVKRRSGICRRSRIGPWRFLPLRFHIEEDYNTFAEGHVLICGMSATMSSGGSDAISGVTILLTDVIPSLTGRRIAERHYALASRLALCFALAVAFVITLFVGDVIAYFQKVVGSLLPGVGVTMLLGRFWRRSTWQGAFASIGAGTLFGVVVLACPAFAGWIRLTFGGPAIPSTLLALCAGVFASLMTPPSTLSEEERLAAVRLAREGCSN